MQRPACWQLAVPCLDLAAPNTAWPMRHFGAIAKGRVCRLIRVSSRKDMVTLVLQLHFSVVCYAVLLQAVLLPLLVDIDRVGPEGAAALRR